MPQSAVMSSSDQDVALAITASSDDVTRFYQANAGNDELFALKLSFSKAKSAAPAPAGR